jgi:hypothetical protein
MCQCGSKRERWEVTLSTGMKIVKSSEVQARSFAARHPGATFRKLEK